MTLYVILFLYMIVGIALFLFVNHLRNRKYLRNLPGPKPVLLFGNTLDFIFSPKSKYFATVRGYIKVHGDVIRVYDGAFSQLVIISNYDLTEYLLSSTKTIDKSCQYDYMHEWLGTGLLTSTGRKWKIHRRIITPSFHFSILAQFVDIFESVGDLFIDKLDREVEKPSVDIYPLVSLCTLDIICEAAMGTSVNAQNDTNSEYVRCVKDLCQIIIERSVSPIHRWLYPLTANYYKEKRAVKVIHAYTEAVIDQKIKDLSKTDRKKRDDESEIKKKLAFLDTLLQCTVEGESFTRTELREEVDTFMFEGHDTTSSAISFALYELAANPDVQQKVLDEQIHMFGNITNPAVGMADLQNMKYLELVLKETLRLYPSVPFYGRQLSEDLEWGQKFAMLELKSIVSKVVRHFQLLPAEPGHVLQLAPETIIISKNGVRIALRKRQNYDK